MYKIDCSKQLIDWIKDAGYSLIDVNLFPRPFASSSSVLYIAVDEIPPLTEQNSAQNPATTLERMF
jgi:hypothetical protein